MTQGICFYIYKKQLYLLPVVLYSLRQHYNGNVHVVTRAIPQEIASIMNREGISHSLDAEPFVDRYRRKAKIWCQKALCHRSQYPYDINLYYDLDHLFIRQFDETIFDIIAKHGLVSSHVHKQIGGAKKARIMASAKLVDIQLDTYRAVNGGCVGARRDSKELVYWLDLIPRMEGWVAKNPEEFALGFTLNQGMGKILDSKWSMAPPITENTIAIHLSRNSYMHSETWKECYFKAKGANFMELGESEDLYLGPMRQHLTQARKQNDSI